MNKFYIYQHRRNDTNEVFYVGKGSGLRAYDKNGRNTYWHRIVNKHGYSIDIIEKALSEQEAFKREEQLIKSIGRYSFKEGPLVNMTNGGDGESGRTVSQETRDKISKANKGRIHSPEVRKNMNKAHLGRKHSQEHKDKISNNSKEKKPVINDLGEIFESAVSAAKAYGFKTTSKICECCKGTINQTGGRKWQYYTKDITNIVITTIGKGAKLIKTKPVINDLGEIFISIAKAAKAYGLKSRSGIGACCMKTAKTAGGRVWNYYIIVKTGE